MGRTEKKRLLVAFTDFWHNQSKEEIQKNHLYVFLSKRYDLELSDDPELLFFSSFGTDFLKYSCPRIFYTGENYRPDLGVADLAVSFDYLDDPRHYRLPLYVLTPGLAGIERERDPGGILSGKSRFCNFIYSNPRCAPRNEFFHKLSAYKRVDSAGKFLNNTGMGLEDSHANLVVNDVPKEAWSDQVKIRFQRQYKFTIAFENSSRPGYTTEKLVDALIADTIPIYWGDPEAGRDLNPKSFINCHDYATLDEVVEVVRAVDQDDDRFMEMLSHPKLTEHARATSLNEDRFFEWLSASLDRLRESNIARPGPTSLAGLAYRARLRHWFWRKFGAPSHVWTLYKRI